MTEQGFDIIRNHLLMTYKNEEIEDVRSNKFDRPVFLNGENGIKVLRKSALHKCTDCPHPCV